MTEKIEKHREPSIRLVKKFWIDVAELFEIGNPRGVGLQNFIHSRIRQTRVNGLDAREVLTEACLRTVKRIEKDRLEIHYLPGWLRRVSLNIISEEVRKNIKHEKVIRDIYTKESYEHEEVISSMNELSSAIRLLNSSLEKLSSKDREMIELRFFEQLSYKEIQEHFLNKGENISQVSALRKQMSRALQRLRLEYYGSLSDKSPC